MVAEDTPSHYALPHWCNVKVKGFMTPACRYRLPIKLVKVLQDGGPPLQNGGSLLLATEIISYLHYVDLVANTVNIEKNND